MHGSSVCLSWKRRKRETEPPERTNPKLRARPYLSLARSLLLLLFLVLRSVIATFLLPACLPVWFTHPLSHARKHTHTHHRHQPLSLSFFLVDQREREKKTFFFEPTLKYKLLALSSATRFFFPRRLHGGGCGGGGGGGVRTTAFATAFAVFLAEASTRFNA